MKKKLAILAIAVSCMLSAVSVNAARDSYKNVKSATLMRTYVNDSSSTKKLHANTRPTSGQGGAYVTIRKSNGTTVLAGKTFPYQTSVSDLTASIPSSTVRRVYVATANTNYRVSGTLTSSMQ